MIEDTNDARTSRWTLEQWIQLFKEVVTAGIGVAIVVYTLYMANATFSMVGDTQRLSGAKDLLLLLLSLAGVVLGYYFGRVPADARSTQAQQQATNAIAQTAQVGAKAEQLAQQIGTTMEKIGNTHGSTIDPATIAELEQMRQQLRNLSDMTRMP